MGRKHFSIGLFLFVLALSACACSTTSPANSSAPPAAADSPAKVALQTSLNFVKAAPSNAQIKAGGQGEAIVRVTVQSGYHVNANPPTYPYLKATELVVASAEGISVGFVTYPASITKEFAFSDKPLAVYEGEIPIKVMLKAPAPATRGTHSLAAKLNIQACDDKVCYPPGTLSLTIPVIIE